MTTPKGISPISGSHTVTVGVVVVGVVVVGVVVVGVVVAVEVSVAVAPIWIVLVGK